MFKFFNSIRKQKTDNYVGKSTQQDCFKELNNITTGYAITKNVGTITMEHKVVGHGHSDHTSNDHTSNESNSCSDHTSNESNMTDGESDLSFKLNDSNSSRVLNEMSSASEQFKRIGAHHEVLVIYLPIGTYQLLSIVESSSKQ